MGYFSPSCVLHVGDNIQQRTWLICRGGALAQLPPQSCICIWNNLHRSGYFCEAVDHFQMPFGGKYGTD